MTGNCATADLGRFQTLECPSSPCLSQSEIAELGIELEIHDDLSG